MKHQILNSLGEPVVLNAREQARADALQRQYNSELKNALGYEISITTLTAISKRVVEQKFFTIPPADFLPVRVGEGAWSSEIITYRDFSVGGDFETGIINTAASDARLAETDAGVDAIHVPIVNWAKQVSWSFFDLQLAAKSGNWDLVTAKERSRKKNWDLGIQKIAFLGSAQNSNIMGLLSQSTVNSNTSVITKYIKSMSESEFSTFVGAIVGAYRTNCAYTAMPTHFIMPELDYDGLAAPVSATYPNISKLDYLTMVFRTITRNPNFQILPCAYSDQINNNLSLNRYVLLNYDEDTIRMDIPVDYTNTLQNTINGLQFQNVGYGQFTGAQAYRPLEVLYFDFAN